MSFIERQTDGNRSQAEEKQGGKKGRLLGIITHSDVLRYIVGEVGIGEADEEAEAEAENAEIPPDA